MFTVNQQNPVVHLCIPLGSIHSVMYIVVIWASGMTQSVTVLARLQQKPDDLSSILRIHSGRENWLPKLSSDLHIYSVIPINLNSLIFDSWHTFSFLPSLSLSLSYTLTHIFHTEFLICSWISLSSHSQLKRLSEWQHNPQYIIEARISCKDCRNNNASFLILVYSKRCCSIDKQTYFSSGNMLNCYIK